MIDDETREVVIKKTWCHGQLVAPGYSFVLLWWYLKRRDQLSALLWLPILYFPLWCYVSYKNVFGDFSYRTITAGGIMAEMCHLVVLIETLKNLKDTMYLILCIASTLFLIETAAFLCVVTALRPKEFRPNNIVGHSSYQETMGLPLDPGVSR
jgi:hypothetical protein